MDCQKCNDLVIDNTNPKQTTFACGVNSQIILNPANKQRWCPKVAHRKGELAKANIQDQTLQTTHKEMQLLQKWADAGKLKTLRGYLKGLARRDKTTCPFSIEQIHVFVQGKIKELENQREKTS